MNGNPREARATARNVPIMAISTGFNVGSIMLFTPILSLILRDLGATDFQVSLASGLWVGVGALFQFQGGKWGDRFGRRPVIIYPTFLGAATLIVVSRAPNWYVFAAIYLGYSIANSIQSPLFSALIGESVAPTRRGRAFGLIEFGIGIGVIIGPMLGAQFLPVVGGKGLILAAGVGWAISGLVRYRYLVETLPESVDTTPFAFRRVLSGSLRYVTIVVVASQVLLTLTMWGPFMALHANDALLLSEQQISLFYGIGAVVSALTSIVAGALVSRIGPFRTLGGAGVAMAAAVLFWATRHQLAAIIVGYVAMGACFQFVIVASDAFRASAVDERIRGSALGAMGTVSGLVSAVVVPLVGYLQGTLGAMLPFWVSALAAGLMLVSVLALDRAMGSVSYATVHEFEGFS